MRTNEQPLFEKFLQGLIGQRFDCVAQTIFAFHVNYNLGKSSSAGILASIHEDVNTNPSVVVLQRTLLDRFLHRHHLFANQSFELHIAICTLKL